MITAIAIDDEPPALKVIEEFSAESGIIELQKTFTRPSEGLKHLRKFPVDLLFLDIQMPSMTGIDLVREVPKEVMVIFTTAHSEFAVEGFNLSAIDYLLKPFTYERFMRAVNKAEEFRHAGMRKDPEGTQHLLIRANYSLVKVPHQEILYVEGLDDYIKIHLPDRSPLVARMTMKNILEKLPSREFIRVHRSFIVPLSKIESVRNKTISIGDVKIPIGLSYEENFFKNFRE
ncbi:MAG TPA: LytTR family DNA-binding domain-containing protein [Bacteroidia bacterium]|nr:LytTR family DNA-binding domain-containing protein [Bacteroidia bacterium]